MKVQVDPERCQGHTLCAMAAPEIFQLSEVDGHASVEDEEVPAGLEQQVKEAFSSCPERAISIF